MRLPGNNLRDNALMSPAATGDEELRRLRAEGAFTPITDSKALVQAGWDHVPHLSAEAKAEILGSTQPYMRDARSKGTPSLGSGAIYPISESEIVVEPFPIPEYFKKGYGLDVGWNKTAAIFGARDPQTDVVYLYAEHYMGEQPPTVHVTSIKARGDWLRGVIDPASNGRVQSDGQQLLVSYRALGLNIEPAHNAVQAGIDMVYQRLTTGRLKVFSTCGFWLSEYRQYHRNEKGVIVKEFDHLMDATRYLIVSGIDRMTLKPERLLGQYGRTGTSTSDDTVGY